MAGVRATESIAVRYCTSRQPLASHVRLTAYKRAHRAELHSIFDLHADSPGTCCTHEQLQSFFFEPLNNSQWCKPIGLCCVAGEQSIGSAVSGICRSLVCWAAAAFAVLYTAQQSFEGKHCFVRVACVFCICQYNFVHCSSHYVCILQLMLPNGTQLLSPTTCTAFKMHFPGGRGLYSVPPRHCLDKPRLVYCAMLAGSLQYCKYTRQLSTYLFFLQALCLCAFVCPAASRFLKPAKLRLRLFEL